MLTNDYKKKQLSETVSREINREIQKFTGKKTEADDLSYIWKETQSIIMNMANEIIGYKTREHRQSWMTDEIRSLMDERSKFKNQSNKDNYQNVQKLIPAKN